MKKIKTRHLHIVNNPQKSKLLTNPVRLCPILEKQVKLKRLKIKRIDVDMNGHEASDRFQRPTNMGNASGCPYANSFADARNNKVPSDATESAEVEEIICLASNVEVPAQVIYQKMPYLSTALKPYCVPELSEETDDSNVITEEEVLEEKAVEIDIKL